MSLEYEPSSEPLHTVILSVALTSVLSTWFMHHVGTINSLNRGGLTSRVQQLTGV